MQDQVRTDLCFVIYIAKFRYLWQLYHISTYYFLVPLRYEKRK